jgi:putative FmdB family regulatory protein
VPIYEFLCNACGHRFEHLTLSVTHRREPGGCPSCGQVNVQKLVSRFAAHGLESQVDAYTGGDDSDLPSPGAPILGRKELNRAKESRRNIG